MNTVWREVDAELRSSRAQTRLAGAAYGVRDWLSDLHAGRPLVAPIDAMPDAPDVRALLDPLQDSALTRLTAASRAAGDVEEEIAESQTSRAEQTPRMVRHVPAATRFAAGEGRATSFFAARPAAQAPATATNTPARVAAMLARHEHVRRRVAEDAVQRLPWGDAQRNERRIVPFSGHRAVGESAPRSQAAGSPTPLTATLARWSAIAAGVPERRLAAATGRAFTGSERTQREVPLVPLDAASLPIRDAPASLERSALAAEPALPTAVLRLGDLAAPALPQNTQRTHAQTPAQAASDAASTPVPPAAMGESVLGRMAGALARIEERLVESRPTAEPRTQWLEDDAILAERIHDILRRQALRHGIDAP